MTRSGGTISILFTDIVGPTELLSRLGDSKWDVVRRTHFTALRDVLAEHSGIEVKNTGDGLMATFGSVIDAIDCSIAMQRRVHQHVGDIDRRAEPVAVLAGGFTRDRPDEVARDLQPPPPDGIADAEVRVGTGQKATLTRLYEAPIAADLQRELVLADIVSGVISNRLKDRVREQLGASYSPYGYASVYTDPDLLVETYINATGDPEQIDELTQVLNAELSTWARTARPPPSSTMRWPRSNIHTTCSTTTCWPSC